MSENHIAIANNRLSFIDMAKAIALVLVLISHTVLPSLMYWSNLFFIPIFFICSGYTTTTNFSLKIKFIKLIIPYFLINILLIGVMSLTEHITSDTLLGVLYGRYSIMSNIEGDNTLRQLQWYNAPTWFLPALFTGYILFKIILKAKNIYHRTILLIAYLVISYAFSRLPVLLPWSLDTAFIFAIYIYIGMLIKNHSITHLPNILTISTLIYIICLILNGIVNLSVRYYGHYILLSIIGAISGSIVIIKSCEILCERFPLSIWTAFNRYALVLFCIQMPFLKLGEILCDRAFLIYDNSTWGGGRNICYTGTYHANTRLSMCYNHLKTIS